MLRFIPAVSAIALLAGAYGQALAQPTAAPAQTPAQANTSSGNLNEVVCQKHEITGSRVGTKRVCKTRKEWADAQLQDRQEVERVQTQRGSAPK